MKPCGSPPASGGKRLWRLGVPAAILLVVAGLWGLTAAPSDAFHFVLLGDRTGETAPGVFARVLQEASAETPAFLLSVGDTIQGMNDSRAGAEWEQVERLLQPVRKIPLYLTPGNHDIWSEASERLFRRYAGHPPHYSFDYRQAHFTILDNSRTEQFSADELQFLENDLREHAGQPLKFVVSHRPSWLIDAALGNREFTLHRLARKYGVQYVIAGHVHQMLHIDLDGVAYVSLPSAGGHLRVSRQYDAGWFFGHTRVDVEGGHAGFQIRELPPPHGEGRLSSLTDWGLLGRLKATSGSP